MTTPEMIEKARAFLATQGNSTPRDILTYLRDTAWDLLGAPPVNNVAIGENNLTTAQLLDYANKWLDGAGELSLVEFLTQIRDTCNQMVLQLPRWKCSMFFKGVDGKPDSTLNFANIDGSESDGHRRYGCEAIVRNGGDTLLFIAEKLLNNTTLWAEVDNALLYGVNIGLKHAIFDLKNDNNNIPWNSAVELARQIKVRYPWANSDQIAFMTCLETNEITSADNTVLVVNELKKIAPMWRVIVGAGSSDLLKNIGGKCKAELWLEIHTSPFNLSQADADKYITNLRALLPYGPVWAGEFWDGSSELSKYISRRALEIGCAGVGSNVG